MNVDRGGTGGSTAVLAVALVVLVVLFGTAAAMTAPVPTGNHGSTQLSFDLADNETDIVDGTVDDTTDTTGDTTEETVDDTTNTTDDTTNTTDDTTETVENTTDDTVTASGSLSTDVTTGDTTASTDTDATLDDGLTTNTSGETSGTVDGSGNASLTAEEDAVSLSTDASVESVSLSAGVVVPVESLLTVLESSDPATGESTDSTSRRLDQAAARGGQFALGSTGEQSGADTGGLDGTGYQRAEAGGDAGSSEPGGTPGPLQSVPGPVQTGVLVGSLAAGGAAATRWRSILRWLRNAVEDSPLAAVLRYSRYDGSDPLAHDDRETIHQVVTDAPGVYLSAISEASGVPLSTVRHHVRVLEEEDLVTSVKIEGKRRYFPADTGDVELHAALSNPSRAAILERLAETEGTRVGELAEALDRDPSTLSHHLGRLEDAGLVEREREGRSVLNRLTPSARDGLAAAAAEPSLADD
ncbi:metalloregulator ArsR/SmtB family transcription factor [Haloarchaeobius sp. HME9146]|uniref:winged helix-turn-helix transcriptional regulator n=1 Tax=Haloarchaeobius sp. HME9146 TaxID=2978732 RepID=UPI0021C1B347|nr:metalloregulator ArsR/SmtB family transcription factor [Haloarchaeobius sp. HME9146]MCT9095480.1 metalloregulator ArsR/SmtB family transcription factor [Haloarchaeobius sp. HME9146]